MFILHPLLGSKDPPKIMSFTEDRYTPPPTQVRLGRSVGGRIGPPGQAQRRCFYLTCRDASTF